MRVTHWMIVAAVFALLLGGWKMAERRGHYRERRGHHERSASFWNITRNIPLESGNGVMYNELFFGPDGRVKENYAREFAAKVDYHRAMARRYLYAEGHPWVGVEADGEEP